MPEVEPKVILRMGSHAEKDYFEKTARFFDGVIIGANLLEVTPSATASFLTKLKKLPYYIDPMTYAFGSYIDRNGQRREDLDWIKSEQKKKDGTLVKDYKSSYRLLASKLGSQIGCCIERDSAITQEDFNSKESLKDLCKNVAQYQIDSIKNIYTQDREWSIFTEVIGPPKVVFAPYFYKEPRKKSISLDTLIEMANLTVNLDLEIPVHMIVCADESYLLDSSFINDLKENLPKTGIKGVWLWFSRFDEKEASETSLNNFRILVEELGNEMEVYNMHGGYFSLALCKYGMNGISHGIGYGEKKDVLPVVGKSIPTVRYYLHDLHKTFGVPDIERCYGSLGINTLEDFYREICNCSICQGVIKNDLANFSEYGDMHYAKSNSVRKSQTPAAAKRCRFHFLLSRIRERNWLKSVNIKEVISDLGNSISKWSSTPLNFDQNLCTHLIKWKKVLQ